MEEKQTNYTIAEDSLLPSGGKIYDTPVKAEVKLRSMTGRQELRRLNPSASQFKTLAEIIEECMIEKPAVHVYDMALGDYEYLLHRLRIATYGDAYKIGVVCPLCGEATETEFHLKDLKLKDFDINKFNELREFKLPKNGDNIRLKFQTPRMLDEIENKARELKRKFKDSDTNFEVLTLLTTVIDTINGGKLDIFKLENYINNLAAEDFNKILNNIDALNASIGLDNRFVVTCKSCGGDVPASFRFGQEFFRPTNI